MPPLPAIRTPHNNNPPSSNPVANAASSWISTRLYGDENATSFFRRLTFSPDGNLLYTPAGWFEDNSVSATSGAGGAGPKEDEPGPGTESSSCVYVYSKANFSKAPVAAYPGHRRAVVCVKFSNALYELRPNVAPSSEMGEPVTVLLEPGKGDAVDIFGNSSAAGKSGTGTGVAGHGFWMGSRSERSLPSPALSAVDVTAGTPRKMPNETPPPPPVTPGTGTGINAENGPGAATASVFDLPYRMMFAVATHDTVAIHDTQQAGPVCLMTKLHYDSFTDMAW
jgi:chromatin assembly factor 1 subunit B